MTDIMSHEEFVGEKNSKTTNFSSHPCFCDPVSSLLTYQRLGKTQQAYVALLSDYLSE